MHSSTVAASLLLAAKWGSSYAASDVLHASTNDHFSQISVRRQDIHTSSLPCATCGDGQVHLNEQSSLYSPPRCTCMASPQCGPECAPSDGNFCNRFFHSYYGDIQRTSVCLTQHLACPHPTVPWEAEEQFLETAGAVGSTLGARLPE